MGAVKPYRRETLERHSESKAVQGRQAACRNYPPTSTRGWTQRPPKSQGLPKATQQGQTEVRFLRFESLSFTPLLQFTLTRMVFRLNTGSEPGFGPCQVLLRVFYLTVAKRAQEREGASYSLV